MFFVFGLKNNLLFYLTWKFLGFIDVADGCYMPTMSPVPCPDASRYVFWDIGHPSEKSYQTISPKIIEELKQKLA